MPILDKSPKQATLPNLKGGISKADLFECKGDESSLNKLHELLERNHKQYDITFGGYKANHTVHGLCSLYWLGASPSQLEQYFKLESSELEPLPPIKVQIDSNNWLDHLGERDMYSSYLPFFEGEVKSRGLVKCIQHFLTHILTGLIGAALHPLIHLSYALEFKSETVASEALAYASSHYSKVSEAVNKLPEPDTNLDEAQTEALKLLQDSLQANLIAPPPHSPDSKLLERVDYIVDKYVDQLKINTANWNCNFANYKAKDKELSLAVTNLFLNSVKDKQYDFFLLHLVTGNHAVQVLFEYMDTDAKVKLLQINYLALQVIFLTQGAPQIDLDGIRTKFQSLEVKEEVNSDALSWKKVIKKAIHSNESHLVKVIRNLYQLETKLNKKGDRISFLGEANMVTDSLCKYDWNFGGVGYTES